MGQILNKQQNEAVKLIGCPVLIFAGAGSGKTRVLTEKIAHLVDEVGIPPEHILSVTFTNKAASELKERILSLIRCDVSKMTVGTFHSVCASLLRKHINILGYDIPQAMEFTFLRKDRLSEQALVSKLPHKLDEKNVEEYDEITLPSYWYKD